MGGGQSNGPGDLVMRLKGPPRRSYFMFRVHNNGTAFQDLRKTVAIDVIINQNTDL